jgi:SAM-dependent methyltransferase
MPIDAKKNELTPFSSVVKCQSCGLGVLSPMPDADEVPSLYALESYYTHGESHIQNRAPAGLDKILTKFAWLADNSRPFDVGEMAGVLPPGSSICDVGCGDALYLKEFKSLGFQVIGVDPDRSARARADESGIQVLEGTAEQLPECLANQSFDLVIMTHSLEHCRDVRRAMANAYRLTRRGGVCYIEVPNCAAEHFRTFTICSEMFDAPRHIYFFTPASLKQLAQHVGYGIRGSRFAGYVRNFMPGWREWEAQIADRVSRADPNRHPKRHTLSASVGLLFRSFWRRPDEKYDSFGLLLARD